MLIKDGYKTYNTGRWKKAVDNDYDMLECPDCGGRVFLDTYIHAVGTKGMNYCPYCGKPMQEDANAEDYN